MAVRQKGVALVRATQIPKFSNLKGKRVAPSNLIFLRDYLDREWCLGWEDEHLLWLVGPHARFGRQIYACFHSIHFFQPYFQWLWALTTNRNKHYPVSLTERGIKIDMKWKDTIFTENTYGNAINSMEKMQKWKRNVRYSSLSVRCRAPGSSCNQHGRQLLLVLICIETIP